MNSQRWNKINFKFSEEQFFQTFLWFSQEEKNTQCQMQYFSLTTNIKYAMRLKLSLLFLSWCKKRCNIWNVRCIIFKTKGQTAYPKKVIVGKNEIWRWGSEHQLCYSFF